MTQVGAFEAKTHFSSLLDRAERGEQITITKHGRPVARLVPVAEIDHEKIKRTIDELKEFSKNYSLDGLSIRELIEEGRR
jgi:prevent-host-death family protein